MDAGRRHEMPGSEIKNFVTYSTASSLSSISPLPPPSVRPSPTGAILRDSGECGT